MSSQTITLDGLLDSSDVYPQNRCVIKNVVSNFCVTSKNFESAPLIAATG